MEKLRAGMNAFDELGSLPGLRRLFEVVWRMFGVNPALVSIDGQQVVIFHQEDRTQPFCQALNRSERGRALCMMCDRTRFLEARRDGQALRYRCHAGLREFIIPVIRHGQTIALLQCGQVHDVAPSTAEWRQAQKSLKEAGIPMGDLGHLFRNNRVLTPDRQDDLLDMLALIAARLTHADEWRLPAAPGQVQAAFGRAITYIEAHLSERLTVSSIAQNANLSTRSLMRLFRKQIGSSVVDFILQRRVERARQLLKENRMTCAEVAFACGFGSVQHFNRIFRRLEKMSPSEWRTNLPSGGRRG